MNIRVGAGGLDSIHDLNGLPWDVREQLYLRLIPPELLEQYVVDRRTLTSAGGERLVRIAAPEDETWARIELRAAEDDRDPVLLLDVGMSPFGVPELAFLQVNDPAAPRFAIDRDPDGQDTLYGTACRNLEEEARALAAGLAPGQVRRGLRLLGRVLDRMDRFCALLGREFYLVEPLFYHSAILYERHGCGYLAGRDLMEEIHAGFAPGGALSRQLDGSTPFRQAELAQSARGRSWAIHDGLMGDDTWSSVKMYRVVGRPADISTFPNGLY